MNSIPGDPVLAIVGDKTAAHNPHALDEYRHKWGFDKPMPQRFLIYIDNLAHGDLGLSTKTQRPVLQDIKDALPATVELALFGITFGFLFGIPLGVFAALNHNTAGDHIARAVALLGTSTPPFWLCLVALSVFYAQLHIAPTIGRLDFILAPPPHVTGMYTVDSLLAGDWPLFWNALSHIILPSVCLGAILMGLYSRLVRESMLRILNSDYIRTARGKGLSERRVILGHALRNALIPFVTVFALDFASLLGGTVLVEVIFAWPGLGRYAAQTAASLDFNATMDVTILVGITFILTNLVVDIVYGLLDPRIRYA
jgi:peptide/nickel transport system permease protein